MARKKGTLTVNDARDLLDMESNGYAIQNHTSHDQGKLDTAAEEAAGDDI